MAQHASPPRRSIALVVLAVAFALQTAAAAQDPETQSLGTFENWSAHAVNGIAEPFCYMASKPIKAEGDYQKRGKIWALISRRPRGAGDVVQFVAGYPFKQDSEIKVVIDRGTTFTLFAEAEDAWAYDGDDRRLIKAMRRGRRMVVTGISWRGNETRDEYSLSGFTKAYNQIRAACKGG